MTKDYISLGLMSGTSCDGIDSSIIKSDGENEVHFMGNQFLPYDEKMKLKIRSLKEKINGGEKFLCKLCHKYLPKDKHVLQKYKQDHKNSVLI